MQRYPMVVAFDMVVCLAMIFLILALTASRTPPHIDTQGLYAVTAAWANGSNDDVDLYVRDPQGDICYFGQSSVGLMHLEQDDLGTGVTGTQVLPDGRTIISSSNIERTVITGISPGEYTVNVHMYTKNDPGPTTVTVQVWALRGSDHVLLQRTVVLARTGDERTVWRFHLSPNGSVSDVNEIPAHLVKVVQYGGG